MHESTSISAPCQGVHTRRGICSDSPSKPAFSTVEKRVPLPSSSGWGSISKTPRAPSPLEPINEATSSGVTHPRLPQHGFYRSRSNSTDLDRQNVDNIVYYFADSLEHITRPEDYRFFGDQARAIMIFKWMKFYGFHPGLSKEIDKPRRDELKDHLNLPINFGQRLASFIITKFNTFRKWGLVCNVKNGIKYHRATDIWLSRTWDGNVEQTRLTVSRDTQSLSSFRVLQKRPAPSLTPDSNKRQRSAMVCGVNTSRSTSIFSDNSTVNQTASLLTEIYRVSATSQATGASQDVLKSGALQRLTTIYPQEDEMLTLRSIVFIDSIPISSATVSGFSKSSGNLSTHNSLDPPDAMETEENRRTPQNQWTRRNSPISMNPVLDHRDLSAKLDELVAKNANKVSGWALPGRFQADLAALKHEETICRRQLNRSIEELDIARNSYKLLLKEYESLKSEIQISVLVLDMACQPSQATVQPNPTGISEVEFLKCLVENFQKRDDTWFELKKAEKLELEKKIAAQCEIKARKKKSAVEEKAKHRELQARIWDRKEDQANYRRQKARCEDLLSGFMDVENATSGTVSPAESMLSDFEDIGME